MRYDFLIVGAGLYGATFARQAVSAGRKVLVIDKRNHIGGNAYTENVEGIQVHQYGPHIFHTNDEAVYNYLSQFCSFNNFVNKPKAFYKEKYYSLPINMNTMTELWGEITADEARKIILKQSCEIMREPQNLEEYAISSVGREIYETLIKGYTEKQWGRSCKDLPISIIKRIPVRYRYDNNYFDAKYQGIPREGYTRMIERMLSGAEVRLGEDYLMNRGYYDSVSEKIVFTGSIDSYFGYQLGRLQYRTLKFETEILDTDNFQNNAVVNYTDTDVPWTRITEHKWFQFGTDARGKRISRTVITKEYSCECEYPDEPYYPIDDERNNELYERYNHLAQACRNVIFGGRLGKYKYYDMDAIVRMALDDSEKELSKSSNSGK